MAFQLTREIVDQIIFGMENQEQEFVVEVETGEVVRNSSTEEGREYVPIPEWRSVDGYHLMERFVTSLRNPIYRERLRDILASGRGVFRQFKDAIKEQREIERMWFRFKEREMRRVVHEWYNELREQWGLERLEFELEEETDDLVREDFVLGEDSEITAEELSVYRSRMLEAALSELPETERAVIEAGWPVVDATENRICWSARTPEGERAAVLCARFADSGTDGPLVLEVLYAEPLYRGLGIVRTLIQEFFEWAEAAGYGAVYAELLGAGRLVGTLLERWGGQEVSRTLRMDLVGWHERMYGADLG